MEEKEMTKLTKKEIVHILAEHHAWLKWPVQGKRAEFVGVDFSGMTLRNKDFSCVTFSGCWFDESDLSGCNFERTYTEDCSFKSAELKKTKWTYARMDCNNFTDAEFTQAIMVRMNAYHCEFVRCHFASTDFSHSRLEQNNFEEAWFPHSIFCGTYLNYSGFNGAEFAHSAWPLFCGSLEARIDDNTAKQLAYHLLSAGLKSPFTSKETKAELSKLVDFANGFNRVMTYDVPKLEVKNEKTS